MPENNMHGIKRILFDAYDGFADKRFKDLDKASRFIVDGRTYNDIAADGGVYGWFCSMFLEVEAADRVTLTILNMPTSPAVEVWLNAHAKQGRYSNVVAITGGQQEIVADLAGRIYDITRPGRRYDTPHYKYAVPRVVDALGKLRATLDQAWPAT